MIDYINHRPKSQASIDYDAVWMLAIAAVGIILRWCMG